MRRTNFKRTKLTRGATKGMLTGACGTSFTTKGQNKLCGFEDYQVNLKINSFNIPELFVEIPETATIGSLKRPKPADNIWPVIGPRRLLFSAVRLLLIFDRTAVATTSQQICLGASTSVAVPVFI